MKYLLDSDVIINYLRHKSLLPHEVTLSSASVSVITYAELLYGVYASDHIKKNLSAVETFFSAGAFPLLAVDSPVVDIFTHTKIFLEKQGRRLDDFELLIASTAIAYDLILVTNNKKHFSRIPTLKILD